MAPDRAFPQRTMVPARANSPHAALPGAAVPTACLDLLALQDCLDALDDSAVAKTSLADAPLIQEPMRSCGAGTRHAACCRTNDSDCARRSNTNGSRRRRGTMRIACTARHAPRDPPRRAGCHGIAVRAFASINRNDDGSSGSSPCAASNARPCAPASPRSDNGPRCSGRAVAGNPPSRCTPRTRRRTRSSGGHQACSSQPFIANDATDRGRRGCRGTP